MSKSSKRKKNKVQKITEEEYVAYLSALKSTPLPTEKPNEKLGTAHILLARIHIPRLPDCFNG